MTLEPITNPTTGELKQYSTDMLDINVVYGITINPSEQFFKDSFRFITIYSVLFNFLQTVNFEYELFPEVSSPPTSRVGSRVCLPRLHFHGYIKFKTYFALTEFYQSEYYKLSKFSSIDIHHDLNPSYPLKNKSIMSPIIKQLKLPYKIIKCNVIKALKSKDFTQRGKSVAQKIKDAFLDIDDDPLEAEASTITSSPRSSVPSDSPYLSDSL